MMIPIYLVSLFWVLAYAWLGWPGVLLVAAVGLLVEAILFRLTRLRDDEDRAIGLERLEVMEAEDSTRNERAA